MAILPPMAEKYPIQSHQYPVPASPFANFVNEFLKSLIHLNKILNKTVSPQKVLSLVTPN